MKDEFIGIDEFMRNLLEENPELAPEVEKANEWYQRNREKIIGTLVSGRVLVIGEDL